MHAGDQSRRVLIVDDEEALAWSLSTRLSKVRPRYSVATAYDGSTALALLNERPVDLLVADVRMPGMSGIDLVLAALQVNPALPVIVMTAFKTAELRRLTDNTSIQFLEKPFEFERFLEVFDRAMSHARKGFSGAVSVQTLPDVVQLYVLANVTGKLTVLEDAHEGHVWFHHGAIPHAVAADLRGEEAFYEIMMWRGGEFSMQLGGAAPEVSISANWQELLMESCRRIDERERSPGQSDGPAKGWTLGPPAPGEPDPFLDAWPDQDPRREPSQAQTHLVQPPLTQPLLTQPLLAQPTQNKKDIPMNIKDSLAKLNTTDGFIGAALVDSESGMLLGQEGGGPVNLEIAAAGNTEVVRAKRKTMANLGLKDGIEDILISLSKQYHIIRPLRGRPTLFFYLALDRQRANLAMARIALADVEKELQV